MIVATKDKVVIKPIEQDSMSKGGIFIPDTAKNKPTTGLVMSSGHDDIKKGQTVVYLQYAGAPIEYNGYKYLIVRAEEILAILEK